MGCRGSACEDELEFGRGTTQRLRQYENRLASSASDSLEIFLSREELARPDNIHYQFFGRRLV